mmetsp:Transcript_22943/g.54309  ORF Transcript_22943/g.54309 Transcript_22943/m.54309 type:complete len:117 (+) Transcript_22943:1182-1532(+)|eukprot:2251016-Rhodomonas_salina.1
MTTVQRSVRVCARSLHTSAVLALDHMRHLLRRRDKAIGQAVGWVTCASTLEGEPQQLTVPSTCAASEGPSPAALSSHARRLRFPGSGSALRLIALRLIAVIPTADPPAPTVVEAVA